MKKLSLAIVAFVLSVSAAFAQTSDTQDLRQKAQARIKENQAGRTNVVVVNPSTATAPSSSDTNSTDSSADSSTSTTQPSSVTVNKVNQNRNPAKAKKVSGSERR